MGEQSLDLFEIAPPEKYKEDLLNRIGGKMEFHFIVATLSERIQNDPKLQDFYKTYDLGNLHKYQTHFLNSVFVQMPDSFDLNTRIAET
jgi:truncated hemoglobin YjbI